MVAAHTLFTINVCTCYKCSFSRHSRKETAIRKANVILNTVASSVALSNKHSNGTEQPLKSPQPYCNTRNPYQTT